MRGVVHHGGPGTVATVARAGVPSLGIPAFFDQPFWCRRLFDLGITPRPIVRRLTIDRLLEGVAQLAGDAGLHARASSIADAVRADPGVAAAVDVLCRDLERSRRATSR